MLDISVFPKAFDELRGINEKLWLNVNGRLALFKKTQIRENGIHTNAHYAEKFVSELGVLLGVPCAEIDIVTRNEEVGCISYSFLEPSDELIDFNALIQNIRESFDSKRMIVKETKESYSVSLMIEALKAVCSDEKQFDDARRKMLQTFLIDSLIEHYDRNPTNISVIRNQNGIRLAPMFDNGTSLSLSIPSEAAECYLQNIQTGLSELRGRCVSKVGADDKSHISYDVLEDYILSNHFEDVKNFLKAVLEKLTPEKINQILSSSNYDGLDDRYKVLIQRKLERNKQNLMTKFQIHSKKNYIEQAMKSTNAVQALNEILCSGDLTSIIPEFEQCVGCEQNDEYQIYTVDQYIFNCIDGINKIDVIANVNNIELPSVNDKDKQLLRWAMMFHDIGKPFVKKERTDKKTGVQKDAFYNHEKASIEIAEPIMERMGFYHKDIERIKQLISYHDSFELKSEKAIRHLIFDENGLGEDNIKLFAAMRIAELEARNPEKKEQGLEDLREFLKITDLVLEKEKEIISKLPVTGKQIKKMGIDGADIGTVQRKMANEVMENPDISKNDLMRIAQVTAKAIRLKRKNENPKRRTSKVFSEEQIEKAINNGMSSQDLASAERLQEMVNFSRELSKTIKQLEKEQSQILTDEI